MTTNQQQPATLECGLNNQPLCCKESDTPQRSQRRRPELAARTVAIRLGHHPALVWNNSWHAPTEPTRCATWHSRSSASRGTRHCITRVDGTATHCTLPEIERSRGTAARPVSGAEGRYRHTVSPLGGFSRLAPLLRRTRRRCRWRGGRVIGVRGRIASSFADQNDWPLLGRLVVGHRHRARR